MIVRNRLQLAQQNKKMYFQTVLLEIAVIGSYWQLVLVISSYFDKKNVIKRKIKIFRFFFLDLMNTQINHQNNEHCKIDHVNYKNKMYKL